MRLLVVCLLLLLLHNFGFAQAKLGLKVSPSIASNRILTDDTEFTAANNSSAGRIKFGLEVDLPFGDNYAFGTGIFYAPKRFGLKGSFTPEDPAGTAYIFKEAYKLQYIELPATVKLFTNEIQPDVKLYFQTGALIGVKIFEDHILDDQDIEIKNFKPYDLAFMFGAGVEFKAGVNTVLFSGISYERGLANVIGKTNGLPKDLIGKNDIVSLNIGVKF